MTRHSWGAALWALALLTFPAQILSAAQWPRTYSWTSNLISDLGVTSCATFDAGRRVERYICSPAHVLANGATVANGMLLAVGAVLLWSAWPRVRTGRIAMAVLTLGGILVMAVGLLPWDTHPAAHDAAALSQAVVQWIGMIVLAVALRGSTRARWVSGLTVVTVVVSMIGFVLFADGISGGPSLALGLGVTERIAFDTLTLWGVALGLVLLRTATPMRGVAADRAGQVSRP